MLAAAAAVSAAAKSRGAPVPPIARVDAAAAAQPSAAARGRSRPRSSPVISPALKQSPAPVVSTAGTGGSTTVCRAPPSPFPRASGAYDDGRGGGAGGS